MIKLLFLIPFIAIDLILLLLRAIYSLLFWENFLLDETGAIIFELTNYVMDELKFE